MKYVLCSLAFGFVLLNSNFVLSGCEEFYVLGSCYVVVQLHEFSRCSSVFVKLSSVKIYLLCVIKIEK